MTLITIIIGLLCALINFKLFGTPAVICDTGRLYTHTSKSFELLHFEWINTTKDILIGHLIRGSLSFKCCILVAIEYKLG